MKILLSGSVWSADTVITSQKHSDASNLFDFEQPAKDVTKVLWVGADRAQLQDGDTLTILRLDQKKLYLVDVPSKSYSVLDLPVDTKKYMPYVAPMEETKVVVTPGAETKKVGSWNATHYTVTTSFPMGSMTQEMWVTKDVDMATWRTVSTAMLAMNPFASTMAEEMKKVDGFPVLTEKSIEIMGTKMRISETVVSVEKKEPTAGLYEVPAGFTEKPFDPMGSMGGGGGRGGRGGRGGMGRRGNKPPPKGG